MKKQLLLISSAILVLGTNLFAQTHYCSSDEKIREAFQNDPNYKTNYDNFRQFAKKYTTDGFNPNEKGVVYQIPTVFHVIHNYGLENVSDATVLNALDDMNDHWRKNLADSSQIQAPFNLIHDDMEVEFVLATKDPNGDCSTGITRHVSELTYSAGDNVKALTKAKIDWPSDEYLNIWIVATIASGAGGYSYFPGISPSIDGIVVLDNQLSALPHEAGHWLALPHPWGGTNDNNIPSNCNDDDGIDDTPNTQGQSSCFNLLRTTCTDDPVPFLDISGNELWPAASGQIHDNVQNVMDYAFCGPENFTQGQKAVVRASLQSSLGGRNNIHTTNNLISTGTDGSSCQPVPIVDFALSNEYTCTNFDNSITNNTYNSTSITYDWTVQGGTLSSSSAAQPSISWDAPGFYDISVTATSPGGSDSETKTGLGKVLSGTPISTFLEGFNSSTFPVNDAADLSKNWFVDPLTNSNTFVRSTEASTEGNSSLKLDIKTTSGVHRLISPLIDLTSADCNDLTFDLAYNKRAGSSIDKLNVKVSTTCGRTWPSANTELELTATQMQTGAASISGSFTPTSDEWQTFTVDMSKYANREVFVMFEVETMNGNTLYLDNISFGCSETPLAPTSIDEKFVSMSLYPNPSSGEVNLNIASSDNNSTIYITDVAGKIVATKTVNMLNGRVNSTISELTGAKLDKGVYFVTVESNSSTKTEKLIIK